MELKGLLLCSERPVTASYHEPASSYPISLKSILISIHIKQVNPEVTAYTFIEEVFH
jgi:hypothetical protein